MKRTLFILLASTLLFSCRKEYKCECETWDGDYYIKTIKAGTRLNAAVKCESTNFNDVDDFCMLEN